MSYFGATPARADCFCSSGRGKDADGGHASLDPPPRLLPQHYTGRPIVSTVVMADFNLCVSLLIVLSCVSVLTQRAEQLSDILRLRKALGVGKNRLVRPVLYENSTIDVTVGVDISNVASIELEDREYCFPVSKKNNISH